MEVRAFSLALIYTYCTSYFTRLRQMQLVLTKPLTQGRLQAPSGQSTSILGTSPETAGVQAHSSP